MVHLLLEEVAVAAGVGHLLGGLRRLLHAAFMLAVYVPAGRRLNGFTASVAGYGLRLFFLDKMSGVPRAHAAVRVVARRRRVKRSLAGSAPSPTLGPSVLVRRCEHAL